MYEQFLHVFAYTVLPDVDAQVPVQTELSEESEKTKWAAKYFC